MKKAFLLLVAMLAFAPPALAADDAANVMVMPQKVASAEVKLLDAAGQDAGTATITVAPHGLLVHIEATGLAPGWHGVHFHGTGDCSDHAEHFKKSGGHAAHDGEKHGLLSAADPHAGDLPNIFASADGTANAEFLTSAIELDMLQDKDGGALMIHAGPDDYRTDPSGNSGDRVSCGVISSERR